MLNKILFLTLFFPLSVLADTATLTWSAVTQMTDGSPVPADKQVTYRIYQNSVVVLATTPLLTFTVQNLTGPGVTVCWKIRAVVDGRESASSNEACKTLANSTIPEAPTNLTAS